MATPFNLCLQRNNNRVYPRRVDEEDLYNMYHKIDIPFEFEGWDDIKIIHSYSNENNLDGVVFLNEIENFDQKSPHHSLDLESHLSKTAKILLDEEERDGNVILAGLMHDIGKVKTQQVVNNIAHYYSHDSVGAYDFLCYKNYYIIFYGYLLTEEYFFSPLYVTQLIRWHMQPYFMEDDIHTQEKYLKLFGESFYSDIYKIYRADLNAR